MMYWEPQTEEGLRAVLARMETIPIGSPLATDPNGTLLYAGDTMIEDIPGYDYMFYDETRKEFILSSYRERSDSGNLVLIEVLDEAPTVSASQGQYGIRRIDIGQAVLLRRGNATTD